MNCSLKKPSYFHNTLDQNGCMHLLAYSCEISLWKCSGVKTGPVKVKTIQISFWGTLVHQTHSQSLQRCKIGQNQSQEHLIKVLPLYFRLVCIDKSLLYRILSQIQNHLTQFLSCNWIYWYKNPSVICFNFDFWMKVIHLRWRLLDAHTNFHNILILPWLEGGG